MRARSALLGGRARRYADGALSESVLDLVNKVRKLLGDEGIGNDDRKGVEHVLLLGTLVLCEDLNVFM